MLKALLSLKLDVLINNTGIRTTMSLLHMPIDEAKAIYNVNVRDTLSLMQAFSPLLLESKGVIMNICSIVGEARYAMSVHFRERHITDD